MMRLQLRRAAPAMVSVLALLVACGGDSGAKIGPPSRLEIVAGNNQSSPVAQPVAVPPTIRVRDENEHNLSGVTVRFTITGGAGTLAADTAITDVNGIATAPAWTLGAVAGPNTLRAQASGLSVSTTITAIGTPGAPATLTLVGPQHFATFVSQSVASSPTVQVTDVYGNPVPGVEVTFTVTLNNGSVVSATATTNAQGIASSGTWTLGATVGLNRLTASVSGTNSVVFEAQGLAVIPSMVAVSPLTQAGFFGAMVPRIPQVRVTTNLGQPVGGIPVLFSVVPGGDATISGGLALSDPVTGIAAPADWKLGVAGSPSMVEATFPGFPGAKITFSATGTFSPYVIEVRFIGTATPAQRDAFASAAMRWMQIIIGDIPDVPVTVNAGNCSSGTPALSETVDDVVIFAQVNAIDGPGGILGSAGPCIRRTQGFYSAVGSMRFDVADLIGLQNTNRLEPVILHEMAHVLGFGTAWTDRGVLSGAGGPDPVFTGPEAVGLWPTFNIPYAGTPVPVENLFGTGTRDSHWRESVLVSELMTGFIEAPGVPTPLSKLTIASFKDIGYTVSYATADAFSGNLMAALRMAGEATPLNDIVLNAQWEVTPLGIVRRVR